jgi:phosphoglycolate phosphatase-like HAD superfamily hydrolase
MPFDLFIFDFDGTLVDSAALKQAAFYELFPHDAAATEVVAAVLAEDPEGSRQRVIKEMLRRLGRSGDELESQLRALVIRYTELTDQVVGNAPELPGASEILTALSRAGKRVYVSSNTPEQALEQLLQRRGWLPLLDGIAGYPANKISTARRLLAEQNIDPGRAAVIGDGQSDRASAEAVGARFFPVTVAGDLLRLGRSWGLV